MCFGSSERGRVTVKVVCVSFKFLRSICILSVQCHANGSAVTVTPSQKMKERERGGRRQTAQYRK